MVRRAVDKEGLGLFVLVVTTSQMRPLGGLQRCVAAQFIVAKTDDDPAIAAHDPVQGLIIVGIGGQYRRVKVGRVRQGVQFDPSLHGKAAVGQTQFINGLTQINRVVRAVQV